MNEVIDIVIIGAGASGLMVASQLKSKEIVVVESNPKIGAKILISGGGKCNITNKDVEASDYLGNPYFIEEVLKQFDQNNLLLWIGKRGLKPKIRTRGQYFCTKSANELVSIFKKETKQHTIALNTELKSISKRGEFFYIDCHNKKYKAKKVVVASGGLSFAKIGASDIGFRVAQSFGHSIINTAPALVGFTLQKEQFFFKALSGISTPVEIQVGDKLCDGALLFAHKGISGPVVLDASLFWQKGSISIDFLPDWSFEPYLDSKKFISSLLPLPKSLSKAFLNEWQIVDRPINQLNKIEKEKLKQLKHYSFAPAGNFGYTKAEATKGGVNTNEIDSKTMMSKKVKNLYFVGEVLDVTGKLGGYNFQWAFSSAVVCAKDLLAETKPTLL